MEQESKSPLISFEEALKAMRENDEYYSSGEYAEDMKALREDPEAVKQFIEFYTTICQA